MMKLEFLLLNKVLFLLFLLKRIENLPGNMTRNYINVVTKLNAFFFVLNDSEKFFTRYDKLDIIYFSVVTISLIFDALFM